jgi:hypothetical protein
LHNSLPYRLTDAWTPAIHERLLPTLLFETIPGFLNPQAANRILETAGAARTVNLAASPLQYFVTRTTPVIIVLAVLRSWIISAKNIFVRDLAS